MDKKRLYNIVLIGMPGCGKTTIGKKLGKKLNITYYDVDEYIEKKHNQKITQIFENGEPYFRQIEKEAVKELSEISPAIISTGGGVVKDQENMECLKKHGKIIFINRPIELIAQNIDVVLRPLLKNGISALEKLYDERINLYKKYCDYEMINDASVEEILTKLVLFVSQDKGSFD